MVWVICVITFIAGMIVGIMTFALMDAAKKADEPKRWWDSDRRE